jgi:lysophospholipid acyltransferase (LPLAT)-like uncharacterized protein
MRSWDRTQIPKPFTGVSLVIGEAIEVVADATEPQLEAARLLLEQRLAALEERARALVVSGFSRT